MTIHKALKLIRTFNHASVKDVAWDLGIDHVRLRQIERGDIDATDEVIEGYAAMFRINAGDIAFFRVAPGVTATERLKNAVAGKLLDILQAIADNSDSLDD